MIKICHTLLKHLNWNLNRCELDMMDLGKLDMYQGGLKMILGRHGIGQNVV
jgi:hypothetical protein